jgi:hypothetical protein
MVTVRTRGTVRNGDRTLAQSDVALRDRAAVDRLVVADVAV